MDSLSRLTNLFMAAFCLGRGCAPTWSLTFLQKSAGAKGFLEKAIYKGESFRARTLFRKHRKVWTLNGVASHGMVMDPMFTLQRGQSYRWRIKNDAEFRAYELPEIQKETFGGFFGKYQ